MELTKGLIDQIDRKRVERVRQMPLAERVLASLRLFGLAGKITVASIRA
ncbi:MAG: hypothetical protein ABFC63_09180 [Thermoguttaceae bacterium]